MEIEIVNVLNGIAVHNESIRALVVFFAATFQYFVVVAIILLGLAGKLHRKVVLTSLLASIIARFGLKAIVLLFVDRARPFLVDASIWQLVHTQITENYQSFPSGHALFFFALSTVVWKSNKKIGIMLFLASSLICIARVFAGVHYPSDILAGAIMGILSGIIFIHINNTTEK